ncbi:MAG: Eco57I restriction-modification methylase domain-containing protein [Bernardetiaceae bacterium]|nr:Eco57I restriction-modification methylase domain-containing protein [Bernardetiaceae bacterium]
MRYKALTPREALNKIFLKLKPTRIEIEKFKTQFRALLDSTNESESEEYHKNLVSDFLKKTYYEAKHFINTKGRNDLVIHNEQQAQSAVGVILEAKKPTNTSEMLTTKNLNAKAFHELLLYYLRERITHKNLELKHLIVTNIHEWFVFDAALFDRLFAQNKILVKRFNDFEEGRLSDKKTSFFYKNIASSALENLEEELEFAYFNLKDYEPLLRQNDKAADNKLIALFKLLSPEHILKLPFANDSNTLDRGFYNELLHIIGLREVKEDGKILIKRNKEGARHSATIIEDTITNLKTLQKLNHIEDIEQFGNDEQEQLFNVGIELSITWVNRILFLKLLEAQLMAYHKGDRAYAFLHLKKIRDFSEVNSLFFRVLAHRPEARDADIRKEFEHIPYLNSSLFEPSELEQKTLVISNLQCHGKIPIFSQTVLKDRQGKKRTGTLNTLAYLFEFLNAYDFSSEGAEEIQEENKTLINASVLGLIFEKINGYSDGSFFTPGFITMYMCRETIRKAIVRKFNEAKGWSCQNFDDLSNKIEDYKEANALINTIKVCDPAVGSGHFLVSALNEIIAIKSELKVLFDRNGRHLNEVSIAVVNDSLYVFDTEQAEEHNYIAPAPLPAKAIKHFLKEDGFDKYNPHVITQRHRIQETLFREKQTIIENCLFGVDINSNSVKICRLRLWIELLKNAYYTFESNFSQLETLPNIDINIKHGNSLISRFPIDADLGKALKKVNNGKKNGNGVHWTIDSYRMAVSSYRNATNKTEKRALERMIADIKSDFTTEITKNDPKAKKLSSLSGELSNLLAQGKFFEMGKKEKTEWESKVQQLTAETESLENELEALKTNKIFMNAFEWRFEFPEVLNDEGDFIGFDVVVGNPPYIRHEEFVGLKTYLNSQFDLYTGTSDLYIFFIERGFSLLKKQGLFSFIIPNKFMQAGYGQPVRRFLLKQNLLEIIDFGDYQIFNRATTYPCILIATKENPTGSLKIAKINTPDFAEDLPVYVSKITNSIQQKSLTDETWILSNPKSQELLSKIVAKGQKLETYVQGTAKRGILTGLTEAFVIKEDKALELLNTNSKHKNHIRPFLLGRDVKPYTVAKSSSYLIKFEKGFTKRFGGSHPIDWFKNEFSEIFNHLITFKEKAEKRTDKGDYYWELRACDYYDKFEKPKIMYQAFQVKPCFIYDESGLYCNNSMWFIPSEDKVLLGILNSKLGWWLISKYCTVIQNGYQLIWKYFGQIPIVTGNRLIRQRIEKSVNRILTLKKQSPTTDTTTLESQIDQLVYELYGLEPEDIKIIEKM